MTTGRIAISIALVLGSCQALAQDISGLPSANQFIPGPSDSPDNVGLVPYSDPNGLAGITPNSQNATPLLYGIAHPRGTVSAMSPPLRSDSLAPAICNRLAESTWYVREEYFHWNERIGGADFVNEYGLLITLGYVKRTGAERYRAELFGGTMNYLGGAQFDDGTTEPMSSKTGYLGFRGEYDLMMEPDWWPNASLFLGVGTRFWFRDLKDGLTDLGTPVTGYQEMWWTIYPYLGLETRRTAFGGSEFYASSRIGVTPLTYEHATWGDAVLYPRFGLTGQVEVGLRGEHFFCAAISEVMTWRESPVARGALQPSSMFFTAGLRTGFTF